MKPRVLVVDDSLTVRMDIGEALQAAGFEAMMCPDLKSARSVLADTDIPLVILDLLLPDGDGFELLRELKSSPRTARTQVLLLSSEAEVESRVRGMGAGADEYVGKPYDLSHVVARARALVHAGRLLKAGQLVEAQKGGRGTQGLRVLVIDDSATYRNQLKESLEGAGYTVQDAPTGEDGLMLAAAIRPSAVIVDGVLPGIDGRTVVRRLKSDAAHRGTPCLLLTAAEGSDDELSSLEAGADAYVRKSEDFSLILVRLAALLRSAVATDDAAGGSLLGPKRLLAVDDSITYLNELASELRQEGYDIVLAKSGEEALALLGAQRVDCILLDLIMPGLSGQDTCRRIKQSPEWRDIPLVMLTARDDRAAMIEGINAGADDYIAKSADFDVLKARLRAQLRRKHFEDENRRAHEKLLRLETEARYTQALEDANRQLASAKEQAEQASRTKSSFLANMSHELRTPLNAIIGFAQLLHDGEVAPEAPEHKEFLGDILASGRHLLRLINDVLDLSKVEAGKLEFHPESVDSAKLVGEVLTTLRTTIAEKQLLVQAEVDPEVREIYVDPSRLKQVLYNYVSNALKFTREGGRISVRARRQGASAFRLEVEDTGIGIAEADVGLLFGEFQQLDAGASKKHAGTGLGLALTRRLVEAQGGSVGLTSTPEQGSTFYAVLPCRAVVGKPLPAPRAFSGVAGSPSILVVEDNETDQATIVRALAKVGYHVETAATGAQALAKCSENAFDAVILDLLLPDMSGVELLRILRNSDRREVIVIVVTAVVERGVLGGLPVHDVLSKPLAETALVHSLKRAGVLPSVKDASDD